MSATQSVETPPVKAIVHIIHAPQEAPAAPRGSMVANLGLTLLLLSIVGSWFWFLPADPLYRLGYALLALTTVSLAALALLRPAARASDRRWWVYLVCLLSICYALGYRIDPARGFSMEAVFWGRVALQLVANISLISLGRSYGMLPALREVRTGFCYGYVRHPVYAMYMLADLTVVALQPSLWNLGVAGLGAAVFLARARLEEGVLRRDSTYAAYMTRVRWRFFPGVH
jgi:isoprenylcysteine carboxyl methyltransferase (ICMT) family protein YpbQ